LLKEEIKLKNNILFNINSKKRENRIFIFNICFGLQLFNRFLSKFDTKIYCNRILLLNIYY